MKIEGYEVICFGSRRNNGKGHRILMRICEECPLYTKGKTSPLKPMWRFIGLVPRFGRRCKLKELYYGKQEE